MEQREVLYELDPKMELTAEAINTLKGFFSGCSINFLIGAGFSCSVLKALGNTEVMLEVLEQYSCTSIDDKKKVDIVIAHIYEHFFNGSIKPILECCDFYDARFNTYHNFAHVLGELLSKRSNPTLGRQMNVFTTNYDPILELTLERNRTLFYNDGFVGRIMPEFSTSNYAISYYRHAIFSDRKSEMPSVNLYKLHGSLTWRVVKDGTIRYEDYVKSISEFAKKTICSKNVSDAIKVTDPTHIETLLANKDVEKLMPDHSLYVDYITEYQGRFFIVNPTKGKFASTVLNKTYHDLLRIFSNEMEKENSLLIAFGFSFRDEHVCDLISRSLMNPSLKLIIFCFNKQEQINISCRIHSSANAITYIYPSDTGETIQLQELCDILRLILWGKK